MTLLLFACAADDPTPQQTMTPVPVVEATTEPTAKPETAQSIVVSLNNYHTRYFDYNEIPFDISVTGNFDSYEVVFVPIESSDGSPELDADGLPYGIGQYKVVVNFALGNTTGSFESDTVVSVVERPMLIVQLTGTSEIPGHINWGEETVILVEEYTIIETDYYIAHLDAGNVYSSWLFPFFDEIIDFVHSFTGLYLPDSGERFNLYFAHDDPPRSIWAPSSDRNSRTGELEVVLNDSFVGIDNYGGLAFFNIQTEMLSVDPFRAVYEFSHEFAHVLDFAFFTDNRNKWSFVHGEGFATLVCAVAEERMSPNASTAVHFPLSVNADVDALSDLFHNSLEYSLSMDSGSAEYNPRTIGSVFYLYIYEEFGMENVIEVFSAMITSPSSPRIAIINNILGVDITDTFPEWFDNNVHRIPGRFV